MKDYKALFERLQGIKEGLETELNAARQENKKLYEEVELLREDASGLMYKPWYLSDEEQAEFASIAYAYRSWPVTDPIGVVQRYGEMLRFMGKIMKQER